MEGEARRGRVRDMLIGGALGVVAAIAALRRRRPAARTTPIGLRAFEDAPCYREALERESSPPLRSRS
jgi:hypothetical protein